jgi:hypothetical protein
MPGRGLEGAQSIQRRQSGGHFPGDLYMSLCHVKWRAMSFVESLDNPDIADDRLALGDENVHLHA